MDLEKLERMAISVKRDLQKYQKETFPFNPDVYDDSILYAKVKNLITLSKNAFPEHKVFFQTAWGRWDDYYRRGSKAISIMDYILEIIELEKISKSKIEEMKIFDSANEKIKEASLSFKKEDYPSVINNLNTALELLLKDILDIPTTITKINTNDLINIMVKHNAGPTQHLKEVKKHVLTIDNKIKHQGYNPSKVDCINAIKSMEELTFKLKKKDIVITDEIREKIYSKL